MAYKSFPDTMRDRKWHYKAHGPFKIMWLIDNYAVCRFKSAMPFVVSVKDLKKTPEECVYAK